jgi:putative heme-binding domain-containing protein
VRGLAAKNPLLRSEILTALRKLDVKPKAEDALPYRLVLEAANKLDSPKDKWSAIELLRQWSGRGFGAEPEEWQGELKLWTRWFGQSFPKEPALPFADLGKGGESKYKMAELLAYLDKEGAKGDVARGRIVFEKANCLKCHKFGKDGEGVGPDLTAVSKRFKRADILEAILFPSKAISDQYRSVTIVTKAGQSITGLAAVQGDTVTVVLNDASKVTLKRGDIDTQVASLVSVMPERLLDELTRAEIADLFAFMESEAK